MKDILTTIIVINLITTSSLVMSDELKDPMTRNEDLTHTNVTVNVTIGNDGNYIYEYTVDSLAENSGEISSMWIDISCDLQLPDTLGLAQMEDYSKDVGDGKHVPVYAESDTGFAPAITVTNMVGFQIFRTPGTIKKGIRIISAYPPTQRTYVLYPVMETDGWDYSAYVEDIEPDENGLYPFPWEDDFIVEGTIQAPACSLDGNEPPDDGGGDDGNTDCKKGEGNAYGFKKGKGHEISKGKHLGHDHNCE